MHVVSALTPRSPIHLVVAQRVSLIFVWLMRLDPESNERDRNLLLPSFPICVYPF